MRRTMHLNCKWPLKKNNITTENCTSDFFRQSNIAFNKTNWFDNRSINRSWESDNSIFVSAIDADDKLFELRCSLIMNDSAQTPPKYSFTIRVAISVVLLLVPSLTLVGNAITIVAVLAYRKLHNKTNPFIVSVAIADSCVSAFVMPFSVYQQFTNNVWRLSDLVCRFSSSFDVMLCTVSIFHLSCLAVDRYLAICRPFLHERLTMHIIACMLLSCWIIPVLISFVPIMNGWYGIEDYFNRAFPIETESCAFVVNIPFSIECSLVAFYIPVVFMAACNAKIYIAANKQSNQIRSLKIAGKQNRLVVVVVVNFIKHQNRAITGERVAARAAPLHLKRKRVHIEAKAAKTLDMIMGCFSVCWFPFFIMNVIDPLIGNRISHIHRMVDLWLGYINSMMNPVLYFFFNRHFNYAYRRLFNCRGCMGYYHYKDGISTGITNTSE